MAGEKKFAKGIYPKDLETKYGTMTKLGLKIDDFSQFVKDMKEEGYVNDDGYLNLVLQKSKEGKPYVTVDTFKPDKDKGDDSQEDNLPF